MSWIASLSNGQTIQEANWIEGQLSPWQAMLKWLRENPDIKVTQLRLQVNGTTAVCIPKAQGYFQARIASGNPLTGEFKDESYGIGTVLGDAIFINWINSSGTIWQEVRPLEENRAHTTLA